jgi:hypothetical protein
MNELFKLLIKECAKPQNYIFFIYLVFTFIIELNLFTI